MNENHFNNILKEAFGDKNLSELARELDMPRSIFQDWVQEKRLPSMKNLKYLRRIADYLNMSLDELLTGETEKKVVTSITFEDQERKYQILINRIK